MSTVIRRACVGHESSSRPSGKQNMQLPHAPPHKVLSSGPVFPPSIWDQQSRSACVARAGYTTEGTGQGRRSQLHLPGRLPSSTWPKAFSCLHDGDYVCGKPCLHARHHKDVTRTAAVVFGGCRDIVLGKRRHLSELPNGIEVRRLW